MAKVNELIAETEIGQTPLLDVLKAVITVAFGTSNYVKVAVIQQLIISLNHNF